MNASKSKHTISGQSRLILTIVMLAGILLSQAARGAVSGAAAFPAAPLAAVTSRVSVASDGAQPDSFSYFASISASGSDVAFYSFATNLVINDTNSV